MSEQTTWRLIDSTQLHVPLESVIFKSLIKCPWYMLKVSLYGKLNWKFSLQFNGDIEPHYNQCIVNGDTLISSSAMSQFKYCDKTEHPMLYISKTTGGYLMTDDIIGREEHFSGIWKSRKKLREIEVYGKFSKDTCFELFGAFSGNY